MDLKDRPEEELVELAKKYGIDARLKGDNRIQAIEKAEILRGWAGLYAITPDKNPIIQAMTETQGFYCAIGFSGHGFQQGPAVGRILSELICDGKTDFDISPFDSGRFEKESQTVEKRAV